MRRSSASAAAAALLVLAGCAGAFSAEPVAPGPGDGPAPRRLIPTSQIVLHSADPHFGGLSGFALSADGQRLVALSDRGFVVTADLRRDPEDRLVGVDNLAVVRLGGADGRRSDSDAEALAMLPDGGWLVGLESPPHLMAYPPGEAGLEEAPVAFALPDAAQGLPGNAGFEAVAVLPAGSVLVLAEAAGRDGTTHRAWIGGVEGWTERDYITAPGFAPTDAALLPGGDVLVLERRLAVPTGLSARLVIIPAASLAGDQALQGRLVGWIGTVPGFDNFEGLAVRAGSAGLEVLVVSDDNYSFLLRTVLMQFELPALE